MRCLAYFISEYEDHAVTTSQWCLSSTSTCTYPFGPAAIQVVRTVADMLHIGYFSTIFDDFPSLFKDPNIFFLFVCSIFCCVFGSLTLFLLWLYERFQNKSDLLLHCSLDLFPLHLWHLNLFGQSWMTLLLLNNSFQWRFCSCIDIGKTHKPHTWSSTGWIFSLFKCIKKKIQ